MRSKSRTERVVDLHEAGTLEAVSAYVIQLNRFGRAKGYRLRFNLDGLPSGKAAPPNLHPDPQGAGLGHALPDHATRLAAARRAFITTPAAGRVGCEADIHTGLLHRSRGGAELLRNTPVEPLICNYSPLCGNRRRSQFVEQRLGFF